MNTMFPLLLMLLGVSHGMNNNCDARQDGAKCYGAQGGSVVLQLMDDASRIFKYQWFKETVQILHGRHDKILSNRIESRSSFTPRNGKLQINKLSGNDGGEYTLEIYFDSSGASPVTRTLQLTIQAPVSSVVLVSKCLAERGMAVFCSAGEGDSPQYSWTLDGLTVKDSQLLSGNSESQIITLKEDVSGQLACSAKNHISSVSEEKRITPCGLETFCDGRQARTTCYGALGGTLVLQLMDNASEIFQYQWLKGQKQMLHWRKNKTVFNQIEYRSSFTSNNGTLRIDDLGRNDDGEYTLKIFDSQRMPSEERTMRLMIQTTVSSVMLTFKCQSQGEMRAACFSEGGDGPQYFWTLDGETLTDSQLLSVSSESQIITLKENVSGRLVCSVRNHISQISACGFLFNNCISPNGTYISHWTHQSRNNLCLEPKTAPTMTPDNSVDPSLLICSSRAAVVILIIIGVFICFACKKNKSQKAEGFAGPEMVNENTSVAVVEMRSSESEL
ncbi:pregnancy-specific beta-1-glycoprotein 4-like [Cheilinus undulatus]|uniref:pregnancy-specific beta-1-glycoprotein 4-like n=1 Tax=Cheilinus undulatus TaxID=241271 RepID=UPI001BD55837|nr:pregnancy-specific beta-1-glycoprotein 4-like [Cheilinus undulatus]